jgi:hypothetical protein
VTSVVIEGQSKAEVAKDYGFTYRWVHTLVTRYLAGGWEAIEPQSRRPQTSPTRMPTELEGGGLQVRHKLPRQPHPRLPTPKTTKRPPEGERNVNEVPIHLLTMTREVTSAALSFNPSGPQCSGHFEHTQNRIPG